jgi:DNA-binding IclR family transcriptional regulator
MPAKGSAQPRKGPVITRAYLEALALEVQLPPVSGAQGILQTMMRHGNAYYDQQERVYRLSFPWMR